MNHVSTAAQEQATVLSTVLSLTDEAILVLEPSGVISGWSQGAERLLGYRAAEVKGKSSADIQAPTTRDLFLQALRDLNANSGTVTCESVLVGADGQFRKARSNLTLIQGDSRAPASVLCRLDVTYHPGSSRDVSTSHLRDLWALLDSVPISFSHLDSDRRFLYVNQAALTSVPAGTTVVFGRHIEDVFGSKIYETLKPNIDLVLSGVECTCEISFEVSDGGIRHYLRHLYPQRSADGTVKGYFAAMVDITDAKVAQQAQLRSEHLLRSTLVREVNHRVKNSLQGLIGMLRLQDVRHADPAALVDHSVSQLMAVSVAFGLASRHGEARILLCDMVQDISHSVGSVSGRNIDVELLPLAAGHPVALSEQHSVNISLVINELIFNAIKHSASFRVQPPVRVVVDRCGDSATLKVINSSGSLPPGFSFVTGVGLGTGLNLVKALVPPDCCSLSIAEGPEGVTSELRLAPPVLIVN